MSPFPALRHSAGRCREEDPSLGCFPRGRAELLGAGQPRRDGERPELLSRTWQSRAEPGTAGTGRLRASPHPRRARGPLEKVRAGRGQAQTPLPCKDGVYVKTEPERSLPAENHPLSSSATRSSPGSFRCVPQHLSASQGGGRGGASPPDRVRERAQNRSGVRKGGSRPPALPWGGAGGHLQPRCGLGALRGPHPAPAPPGPAAPRQGEAAGASPPPGAEPAGLVPSPPAGKRPIPAGTGAAPPAVTWAGPHRGRRKEPQPEAEPPLPRRAQTGTHPRDTGRRQAGGHRGRAAPLFQGVLLVWFFFLLPPP